MIVKKYNYCILRLNIKDKEFSMIISMHKVKHKWWRERWESVAFLLSGQRGTRDLAVFEALPLTLPCTHLQSVHLCNNPQHTEWVYKLIKFKQNFYITVDILIHFKHFFKINTNHIIGFDRYWNLYKINNL